MSKEIDKIIGACKLEKKGPYNAFEVCPLLSQLFNCQIHIIEGLQSKQAAMISFPSQFDSNLPQLILVKVEPNHVTFVSNLKMFFRHFNKRICFSCLKTFSPRYRHVCLIGHCFSCRRRYVHDESKITNDPFFEFCDSQIKGREVAVPITCIKCNAYSLSEECHKGHKRVCGKDTAKGRAGYICPDCGTFSYTGFPNAEMAKLKHSCNPGRKNCKICGLVLYENHQCLIKPSEATNKWPNLAFFSFSYKYLAQCKDCYHIKKKFLEENNITWNELLKHEQLETLVCEIHLNNYNCDAEPNMAVIYKEVERGIFLRYVITEDNLVISKQSEKKIDALYFPKDFNGLKPFTTFDSYLKKTKSFETSRNNLIAKSKKSLIENFLLLITQPEWQNTTFLSYGANNCSNLSILKGFLELDLIPFVLQNGNKVNLVYLEFLQLRFLNASSFISGGLEDWCAMFEHDEEIYYFPEK